MGLDISGKKLNRLRWLHGELSKGYCPDLNRLAHGLGVSCKTVQRLMADLRDHFGALIEYDCTRRGYLYLRKPVHIGRAFAAVELTGDDRVNVGLGVKALDFLSLKAASRELRRWISQASGESVGLSIKELDRHISFAEVRRALVVTTDIGEMLRAIQRRYRVEFKYTPASTQTTALRQVDPYHLTYREAAWYLIGFDHDRQELRTFALSRMASVRTHKELSFADPDFNPQQYFHDAGIIQNGRRQKVHLVFSGPAVKRIEERDYQFDYVSPQRQYRRDEQGHLHLEFRHSLLEALLPMVLSFGKDVRVRAPRRLKELLRLELLGALANLDDLPPPQSARIARAAARPLPIALLSEGNHR